MKGIQNSSKYYSAMKKNRKYGNPSNIPRGTYNFLIHLIRFHRQITNFKLTKVGILGQTNQKSIFTGWIDNTSIYKFQLSSCHSSQKSAELLPFLKKFSQSHGYLNEIVCYNDEMRFRKNMLREVLKLFCSSLISGRQIFVYSDGFRILDWCKKAVFKV